MNKLNLIVFEDDQSAGFYPMSETHPIFDLLVGCHNIVERLRLYFRPVAFSIICRRDLADIARLQHGDLTVNAIKPNRYDTIVINSSLKPDIAVFQELASAKQDILFFDDGILLGGKLSAGSLKRLDDWLLSLPENPSLIEFEFRQKSWARYANLWEMISDNGRIIEFDFHLLRSQKARLAAFAVKGKTMVHKKARIAKGAFLDTEGGPIIIDDGAYVEPRSLIQGPAYIGRHTRVMAGMVREGCSIGPVCKVGGEIEESIILGYSNKCHEGFIGHSYIGEWVNLGALTTNSDLKNNYTSVRAVVRGKEFDTGLIKVGSLIGDHTKTGIGTLFNTGIVIGFCCNLFGGGLFTQKEIAPFTWGTPKSMIKFELDKAIQIAKMAMSRRNVEFTEVHEKLFEMLANKHLETKSSA